VASAGGHRRACVCGSDPGLRTVHAVCHDYREVAPWACSSDG
jgi:hypothetical protein